MCVAPKEALRQPPPKGCSEGSKTWREKGDFIKELADFIKELAAAKGDFVKVKEFVSSSPSPPAQESKCNEYGDVGLRRGGGRKRDPYKWFNSLDESKAAEICAMCSERF
jgi:hypothetical protein